MIKLTGREVTPELEQTIRSTAEAAVYLMKQKDQVPVPVAEPEPILDIAPTQPPEITPVVEAQPVIDTVQQPA